MFGDVRRVISFTRYNLVIGGICSVHVISGSELMQMIVSTRGMLSIGLVGDDGLRVMNIIVGLMWMNNVVESNLVVYVVRCKGVLNIVSIQETVGVEWEQMCEYITLPLVNCVRYWIDGCGLKMLIGGVGLQWRVVNGTLHMVMIFCVVLIHVVIRVGMKRIVLSTVLRQMVGDVELGHLSVAILVIWSVESTRDIYATGLMNIVFTDLRRTVTIEVRWRRSISKVERRQNVNEIRWRRNINKAGRRRNIDEAGRRLNYITNSNVIELKRMLVGVAEAILSIGLAHVCSTMSLIVFVGPVQMVVSGAGLRWFT